MVIGVILLAPVAYGAEDFKFSLADGFQIERLMREPDVRQPLVINFDERGRMWVVQYMQYPFPNGLKVIGHDEYWRVQYEHFPPPPPPAAWRG